MNESWHPTPALRSWLRANALFSGLSGLAIVLGAGRLPSLLGAGGRVGYLILGAALVLYGLHLRHLSVRRLRRVEVGAVVAGDVLWVVGSAVVLSAGLLSPAGGWIVAAVAVVVAVFAVGQWRGISRDSSHA